MRHYWGKYDEASPAGAAIENMYRIMRVKGGRAPAEEELLAREVRWDELLAVMEAMEKKHGWEKQDGTSAYTRDQDVSHKSRVLG